MVHGEGTHVTVTETPPTPDWAEHARRALEEDAASRDATTQLLGATADAAAIGSFRAEEDFVLAGLPMVEAIFRQLAPDVGIAHEWEEGAPVRNGATLAVVRASARVLLAGERVALNYVQRLSGIATITRQAVNTLAGTGAVVTDTRKTTPGLRSVEKYAVRVGGGVNHRQSLSDAILWKDNHWALLATESRSFHDAIRSAPPDLPLQVEVETEQQLETALAAGAKMLLVDNQPPEIVAQWTARAGPEVVIEASGGIAPADAGAYARAGAHRISIGALTHSPKAVSISFEIGLEERGTKSE